MRLSVPRRSAYGSAAIASDARSTEALLAGSASDAAEASSTSTLLRAPAHGTPPAHGMPTYSTICLVMHKLHTLYILRIAEAEQSHKKGNCFHSNNNQSNPNLPAFWWQRHQARAHRSSRAQCFEHGALSWSQLHCRRALVAGLLLRIRLATHRWCALSSERRGFIRGHTSWRQPLFWLTTHKCLPRDRETGTLAASADRSSLPCKRRPATSTKRSSFCSMYSSVAVCTPHAKAQLSWPEGHLLNRPVSVHPFNTSCHHLMSQPFHVIRCHVPSTAISPHCRGTVKQGRALGHAEGRDKTVCVKGLPPEAPTARGRSRPAQCRIGGPRSRSGSKKGPEQGAELLPGLSLSGPRCKRSATEPLAHSRQYASNFSQKRQGLPYHEACTQRHKINKRPPTLTLPHSTFQDLWYSQCVLL